ncbi:hypothetical protein ABZ635_20170 [Nocardiopsis sp. NPDC007018]|uniref:hypothetical protein n=1 Tax=Nocardiopsis sp. NPDC007018 TaxID=3155721 RepID=UPI0033C46EA0
MEPQDAFNLTGAVLLTVLLVGFLCWPKKVERPKGDRRSLIPLRAAVWVAYGVMVLLLTTDVAWPQFLTGVSSQSEGPDCPPVLGRAAWVLTPQGVSEATCAGLANARVGWALLFGVVGTLFLAALTRARVLADVAASAGSPAAGRSVGDEPPRSP